jgi:hypothetical protein
VHEKHERRETNLSDDTDEGVLRANTVTPVVDPENASVVATEEEEEKKDFCTIFFSRNGAWREVAFVLTEKETRDFGSFHPSVSLYTHGKREREAEVAFNFGPIFVYPPAEATDRLGEAFVSPRPMCESAS